MDNLGIDDKIIENLNILTKIWQLEVATQLVFKRFISSRVIRGSAFGGDERFLATNWFDENRR